MAGNYLVRNGPSRFTDTPGWVHVVGYVGYHRATGISLMDHTARSNTASVPVNLRTSGSRAGWPVPYDSTLGGKRALRQRRAGKYVVLSTDVTHHCIGHINS